MCEARGLCLIGRVLRVLPIVLLTACASVGGVQLAETVGKGNLQIAVEPGVQVLGGLPVLQVYPHLDAAVRYGFTDQLDLGLRAGWSFLEAQAKWMLTEPKRGGLIFSVAPTLGGMVVTSGETSLSGFLNAATPVLLGIPIGADELVLGVRSQHLVFVGGGSLIPTYSLGVGGSVGFALRFSDTLTLLPEVAAVWPVYGGQPVTRSDGTNADFAYGAAQVGIFQFKLGFLLDRRAPKPP